jgi:hypothetical protein
MVKIVLSKSILKMHYTFYVLKNPLALRDFCHRVNEPLKGSDEFAPKLVLSATHKKFLFEKL